MFGLLSVVPLPWKILGIVLFSVGLWGAGEMFGAGRVQTKFDAYRGEVATTAAAQATVVAAEKREQARIEKESEDDHIRNLQAVAAAYSADARRVRGNADGGCTVREFSAPAGVGGGKPADHGPAANSPSVEVRTEQDAADVIQACARTTVMFLDLREEWRKQAAVK